MALERTCRYEPLTRAPLVLVLCEVRFSPIKQIASYIAPIQERFRRSGFPIERGGKVRAVTVSPSGIQAAERDRWEYRTKDERWSVMITENSVILQTTAYERFETFAERLSGALRTVLAETEHDRLGVVQRVGLRYIDLVQPREGEDHRFYLKPGLHGVTEGVFAAGSQRLFQVNVGHTQVGDVEGFMVLRITQNDQGIDVPPDLVDGAPKLESRSRVGELVTFVDMDHFIERNFEPNTDEVIAYSYRLHDHIIETFHEHIVTKEGMDVWR